MKQRGRAITEAYHPAGPRARERLGQRFGRWTVVRVLGYRPRQRGNLIVLARCGCGRERPVQISNLARGRSSQCERCRRAYIGRQLRAARDERRRAREREMLAAGTPIIGWTDHGEPLFACPCCGAPSSSRGCRSYATRNLPRKYPESTSTVARRYGISKQRVHQLIVARGWEGMIRFLNDRYPAAARAGIKG